MLSLVFTYYNQPKILARQIAEISRYPTECLKEMELVIVDDGSKIPLNLSQVSSAGCSVKAARVTEDIPWNQMGARNLAVHLATQPWMYLMDLDHLILRTEIAAVLSYPFREMEIYRQERKCLTTGEQLHPPMNLYVARKQDWMKTGGMDEDFRGNKGWSDVLFRRHLANLGFKEKIFPGVLIAVAKNDFWGVNDVPSIPDASTRGLSREIRHNEDLLRRKVKRIKRFGWDDYREKKKILRFPWVEIDTGMSHA